MPRVWWPYAAKHYCWLHNVIPRKGRPSPYFMRHKHNFKGTLIPFAALVEYIPNKAKAKALPKFDTATRPGLMLGYHVHPGGRWSKDYLIADLDDFRGKLGDTRKVRVFRVPDVIFDPENEDNLKFPLKAAFDEVRTSMVSLCMSYQ